MMNLDSANGEYLCKKGGLSSTFGLCTILVVEPLSSTTPNAAMTCKVAL